jgi:vesicle coat complex subunit
VKSNESRATPNQRNPPTNPTDSPYTFQQQTNKQDSQMTTDLYTEIIQSTDMTNTFDRDSLISDYAEMVVDDMDLKTLVQLAYDVICENMERMTDNEIVEDVNNCYPELLEQYNIDPDLYL